jgi:hypothetical protein
MAPHRSDPNVVDTEVAQSGSNREQRRSTTMNHPEIARQIVEEHINDLYREADAARLVSLAREPGRSVMARLASSLRAAREAVAPSSPLPRQPRTSTRS